MQTTSGVVASESVVTKGEANRAKTARSIAEVQAIVLRRLVPKIARIGRQILFQRCQTEPVNRQPTARKPRILGQGRGTPPARLSSPRDRRVQTCDCARHPITDAQPPRLRPGKATHTSCWLHCSNGMQHGVKRRLEPITNQPP